MDPLLVQAQAENVLTMEEACALDDLSEADTEPPESLFDAIERLSQWLQRTDRHYH
jgi:hypothetical protein